MPNRVPRFCNNCSTRTRNVVISRDVGCCNNLFSLFVSRVKIHTCHYAEMDTALQLHQCSGILPEPTIG